MPSSTLPAAQLAAVPTRPASTGRLAWTRALPSAALALGVLILLLTDSSQLLGDPDSIWHVATGRWIWEHGRLPWVDVFSHTFDGAPWIAKEWLSQLVLYATHAAAGWWGAVALAAACIAGAFVLLHEWLRRRLRPAIALLMTLAAILLGTPHFLARPHVLVLPVVAIWMGILVGASERGRAPPAAVAFLMVAWANMHGSFPLGLGLAVLLAAETIAFAAPDRRTAVCRDWLVFLVLAGVATLVSPYGWHAILVPLTIGGAESLRYVDEWKPLHLDIVGCAALAGLATAALLVLRDARREAIRAVAIALLGLMMIRHARFIGLFGLIVPFLVARVLVTRWGAAVRATGPAHPALATALAAPLVVVVLLLATMRPAPVERIAPERALAAARSHGLSGSVYNAYDFGGFLIGNGIKTFVDGRSDQLFLGDFLPALQAAREAGDSQAFAHMLAAHHVTWALVKPRSKDVARLEAMPGWSRLYEDRVAAVYRQSGVAAVYRQDERPLAQAGARSTTP